uniref:Uncharacterized protein n=1 Tax=Corethron hystrix TaxID=216773 RepID=A0A7S1BIL3_9STRA|mmetsp:Transcript_27599/g.63259  ORF Transcript_27599/g.63259 Transcript_27599/m.63259 type:complete len:137 (+) Transcript_27599:94-504(+)|eukprot:CAMPEP_0113316674 /NCGR_PEP_ID=MMETSP0010_2-20120614/11863_1 /TAXON_ID=216773 ORGANISM="Corethron hystrix, Strain 308" /NCGR_SAMPLE_ID=MMETSP0010_2 /ASSEMBLY_ACC=CAM_ASM_000155 /LENGTH=136 /DNA_ID=CAMNT_0000173453 /DNA_START=32 /DNA_END=442 /DNA_ORIENTATION=+ /assembly_acc=CAM_ASM_000155
MVFWRKKDDISGSLNLPPAFPLAPKECTKQSQALFECLESSDGDSATNRLRSLQAKNKQKQQQQQDQKIIQEDKTNGKGESTGNNVVETAEDILRPCSKLIKNYTTCVDRALTKQKNAKLLENYRVQDEYRYIAKS